MQAFWNFLYLLQHASSQASAVGDHGIVYGGNALQAFVTALTDHLRFVWQDGPWQGGAPF